ncbi:MAG TPA: hypothetical protein VJT54_12090 [Verrucomicrobiae bacterium]|nr:hypothetical protein [Verrucomicrobiae bacterium]
MKISTQITAALVAMGIVSQAMATDPVVYLTGSTAFRSTVFSSLSDNTGTSNAVFQAGTITYGTWGNSSASGANYMVFHGTLTNGQAVYIDCAWSGSEAGIASACNTTLQNVRRDGTTTPLAGSPETWVDYTTATLTAAGNVQSANPNGANGASLEGSSHGADLAQADTSQAVSWTPATNNTVTALKDYGSQGVVTFTMTRNVNPNPSQDWLDCSNITLPQIITLTANGYTPAWFITGNPNDLMDVYLVGRNLGSGTRMNFLSDSNYGSHRGVVQNSIGYGVDNRDPSQSTALVLQNEGNNGYESGGGVAKALANTGTSSTSGSCQQLDPVHNTGTGWFAIGYLSPSDALNTGNNGGQTPPLFNNTNDWVTVDGIMSNNNNIENGQWWYWGHEHLYGKFQISGIQDTVGNVLLNAVSSKIISQNLGVAPGGHDAAIPYSLMFVTKSSDVSFPSF